VPVAVETLGALREEATAFISDLGGQIAAMTGDPRSFNLQSLSVAIQLRGNAACVTGTSLSEDIFYLLI